MAISSDTPPSERLIHSMASYTSGTSLFRYPTVGTPDTLCGGRIGQYNNVPIPHRRNA